MNYHITKDNRIPAYYQIYEQLREDIIKGIYPQGSKIPSKRIIAQELDISLITVKHALELLCEEGYIEGKERSGYYVIFSKDDFWGSSGDRPNTGKKEASLNNHLLNQNETPQDSFPFSVLAKTMRKVILDYADKILIKSPNCGCDYLRKEICNFLARNRAIYVEPYQIIVGSGAEYLYGLVAQLFDSNTIFAIENPSYEIIAKVYDSLKIPYERLTLLPEGISSKELKNTKAKVLHTTPFNSFPSGITINSSKKHEYLNWAKKVNGYIIEDNYDSELTVSSKPEDTLLSLSDKDNVIYINTFSKTISPAMRIGYMILPKALLDIYNEKLGFYSCTVPVFDQYVIAELLRSGDFERHINRERRKRRKLQKEDI